MTYTQYYRAALHVPFALALFGWIALGIGMLLEQADVPIPVPHWVAILVIVLAYAGVGYLVPYLLAFGWIMRRSERWSVRTFRWALFAFPLGFAVGAGLLALVLNAAAESAEAFAAARDVFLGVLVVGGAQALLIAIGDILGTRFGWLSRAPEHARDVRVA